MKIFLSADDSEDIMAKAIGKVASVLGHEIEANSEKAEVAVTLSAKNALQTLKETEVPLVIIAVTRAEDLNAANSLVANFPDRVKVVLTSERFVVNFLSLLSKEAS